MTTLLKIILVFRSYVGSGVGVAVGSGVGVAVGSGVGVVVGSGVGVAVGSDVGVAVGSGVGVAVGSNVGVKILVGAIVSIGISVGVETILFTGSEQPPKATPSNKQIVVLNIFLLMFSPFCTNLKQNRKHPLNASRKISLL